MSSQPATPFAPEYVVVGSGAGGGTVAARLAECGRRVLVLEAGGDPRGEPAAAPAEGGAGRQPDDYDVPAFHPFATENQAMRWDFFVRHYADDERQRRDPAYRATHDGRAVDGVLYPRAGTLGGCTAHNAMIMVYPHNTDWDGIATLTGDASWAAGAMRGYFERLEDCRHRLPYRWLARLGANPTRHGFDGWLRTEKAIPKSALGDGDLLRVLLKSVHEAFERREQTRRCFGWLLKGQGDPNDWRLVEQDAYGLAYTPLTTRRHGRTGTRERLLDIARRHPDRLRIETHALATRVIFADGGRAVGVEYLKGERLYRASAPAGGGSGTLREARATREVILAGGAFNTPQLLMLSGVGEAAALRAHGIPVRVDLPGVGRNLQDRYEVGVVNRMNFPAWEVLEEARFAPGDAPHRDWQRRRRGVYTTNGAVLAVTRRSTPERPLPDLFCFALLGLFKGYFPGYSALFPAHRNYLTWAILKAHTRNRAGSVTLRSADPLDTPRIDFRYFEEGDDAGGEDLQSVVEGIRFVRRLTAGLKRRRLIEAEELPGDGVDSDEELRRFVRDHAWGHHASCTCAIGPREAGGVLDSRFRVHGTRGLRVVDASVFPRIPGYFIVSAVYMVGEKAADVILEEAS